MGAVAGIASAGMGLFGSITAAQGQEQMAAATSASDLYQAQVAANNAVIARRNASMEMKSGEIAAQNFGLQARAKIGSGVAGQGASGVDANTGSFAAVRAGADQMSMLDALTIRSDAARRAYGYQVQGTNFTAQSQLDTMSAANAVQAGDIASEGSLISGASTVAGAFSKYGNSAGLGNLGSFFSF